MKVIIVGLPLFSKRLAKGLSNFDKQNNYKRFDTYYSRVDRFKALLAIRNATCVYSINGTLNKSRLVDIAIKKNIPVIMNWVGSDVIHALKSYSSGNYRKEYIKGVIHQCEVGWIQEELKEMNIEAEISNFAYFDKEFELSPSNSEKLTILSYIASTRSDFYGMDTTLRLAKKFSDIDFIIVGTMGEGYLPLPANVSALGWVENMGEIFDQVHICLRFPKHDGLSNFILEALARGKTVLYKYPFDHCEECPDEKVLENTLHKFQELFNNGDLLRNIEGASFISKNFNKHNILSGLVERFKRLSNRK